MEYKKVNRFPLTRTPIKDKVAYRNWQKIQYLKNHKEEARAAVRRYQKTDKARAKYKERYAKDPQRFLNYNRKYLASMTPEEKAIYKFKISEYQKKYRALKTIANVNTSTATNCSNTRCTKTKNYTTKRGVLIQFFTEGKKYYYTAKRGLFNYKSHLFREFVKCRADALEEYGS